MEICIVESLLYMQERERQEKKGVNNYKEE